MRISFGLGAALLAGTTLLAANGAWAATEQQNLSVVATVTNVCDLSTSNTLDFGSVENNDPTDKDASATITITCSADPATGSSLVVGGGLNYAKKTNYISSRALLTGGNNTVQSKLLAYDLYSDVYVTKITKDGEATLSSYTGSVATSVIKGRIPKGQSADEGSYTDTVLLTFTYEPAPAPAP